MTCGRFIILLIRWNYRPLPAELKTRLLTALKHTVEPPKERTLSSLYPRVTEGVSEATFRHHTSLLFHLKKTGKDAQRQQDDYRLQLGACVLA